MKPYYQEGLVTLYCSDALTVLRELESDSIDLLCTDPPYGIGFMGKDWDKALPDKKIWSECLRVLKPGAFGFVMSIPRADCLSRMIISLEDVGFRVDFTPIYWAYASGFPKAQNIGKAVDKRLGAEREYISENQWAYKGDVGISFKLDGRDNPKSSGHKPITNPSTPQAKALDGSYGGFQPKPAVEVIIVCMKPLSEKTFVDQALLNQKGITWLDDCRVPYELNNEANTRGNRGLGRSRGGYQDKYVGGELDNPIVEYSQLSGRFPANLLVSDDVLNDGRDRKVGNLSPGMGKGYHIDKGTSFGTGCNPLKEYGGDSGSFSRYFDLDKWAQKTFPFLLCAKASKSEKDKGLGDIEPIQTNDGRNKLPDNAFQRGKTYRTNSHPTVKPLKLMSYLITLGSREGDIVLDPFGGSGTTALASKLLSRKCIISEIEEKYCEISAKRYSQSVMRLEI